MSKLFLDNFSGEVSELKGKNRTDENILKVLSKSPMVSTWEMSENTWLWKGIDRLKKAGLLIELEQPYPWHKYKVVESAISQYKEAIRAIIKRNAKEVE